ncbi:sodium:solute symporter family protein [Micrococcus lylae]|uniref:sodium:solute symporter family protein n=1 Tax=Micrococcus lylae TaxID=1273 RepID=UPI000B3537F3|nr:sodium:solute symporter family protein [Micrococcus lylae]
MNIPLVTVVVPYMAATFVVAWRLKSRVTDNEDYLLAGRNIGTTLMATMLLAINFGGAFVLGTSQDAYAVGFAAVSFAIGIFFGLTCLGLFVTRRVRSTQFSTVPDFLSRRFRSTALAVLVSLMSIIALTGILGGQIAAIGSAFTTLGLTYETSAIIGTVLIIVLTALSGMWGVAVTDFIQFCVITVGLVVITVMSVSAAGGIGAISATYEAAGVSDPFNPWNQGWAFFLGAALPVFVHKQVGQDVMQRVFAAKTTTVARRGAIIAGVLTALFAVFPALSGMAAKTLIPDLDPSVGAIPALIQDVLPVWAAGIFVAALISAVISTADAILLAIVSNISSDLIARLPQKTAQTLGSLTATRIITVVVGGLALVASLLVPNIITILTMAFTMYGAGVFALFFMGLFTNFGGKISAIGSLLVGSALGLAGVLGWKPIEVVPPVASAVAAALVTYVALAVLTGERQKDSILQNENASTV